MGNVSKSSTKHIERKIRQIVELSDIWQETVAEESVSDSRQYLKFNKWNMSMTLILERVTKAQSVNVITI